MKIEIKPLEMQDVPAVFEAIDESKAEVSRWMDWCRSDYTPADAESWIEAAVHGRAEGSNYQFGIFDSEGRFLGACGISGIERQAKYANLGYWVRTRDSGRGIAAEAARQVVDWAFTNTDLQRIEILAAVGNRRSQRVAEKIGAVREGVLRSRLKVFGRFHDAVLYSIVRGDRKSSVLQKGGQSPFSWLKRGQRLKNGSEPFSNKEKGL